MISEKKRNFHITLHNSMISVLNNNKMKAMRYNGKISGHLKVFAIHFIIHVVTIN